MFIYLFFEFYFILFFCFTHAKYVCFVLLFHLSRSSLDEVDLEVLLEVEVGEDLILANLEELGELGIRVDLSARNLVLKLVGGDVGVDLLTDLNTGHHGASLLAEELEELLTENGGLNESGGLSVGVGSLLASLGLGSVLELARNRLLEDLVVGLHGGQDGSDLLDLGAKVVQLGSKGGCINRGLGSGGLSNNRSLNNRGRSGSNNSLGLLLGLGLLLYDGGRLNSDSNSGGSNRGIRLSSFSDHFLLYTL